MLLAPEEVFLKKRTVVSLETRTDAKGTAGRVISLGIGIVCISFQAHLLRTSYFICSVPHVFGLTFVSDNPESRFCSFGLRQNYSTFPHAFV